MESLSVSNSMKGSPSCGPSLETSPPTSRLTTTLDLESLTYAIASRKAEIMQARLLEAQANAQAAQFVATQEGHRLRPCLMYPCKLYHNDVTWICEFVHCSDAVGCGDSPAAAQLAFDMMWLGTHGVDR